MQNFEEYKKHFVILVVDDNENNVFTLTHRLKREGFDNVKTAYNGPDALEIIAKDNIDLVLLDIMMPGMSGYEVLEKLKDHIIHRRLMVLMISAEDSLESIVKCIKNGAEDFLPKPFNVDLLRVRIGSCMEKKWFTDQENHYRDQIETERKQYKDLLNSIFPSAVVNELTTTNEVKPRNYQNTAVMFADVVGFTKYCDSHSPEEILNNLQALVNEFETCALKYNVGKIKTIGDAFMATAGMLEESDNPVLDCIKCCEEMIKITPTLPAKWQLSVGISYGEVIAGIVGHRQYLYDVWGDTVNTASRLQALAEPDKIYLSKEAWAKIQDSCEAEPLGACVIKGKGCMDVFKYIGPKKPT